MYDFTYGEFAENITRVENLIGAYKELEKNSIGIIQLRTDVLRASVVFLHSSLEEVIRNLFLFRLPKGNPENLDKIPLVGQESYQRPKTILLGCLIMHRGRFVENVIKDSIDAYVNTMNINGTEELAKYLEMAEIQVKPFQKYFSSLDSLMKRRHQIVHQMDRTNSLNSPQSPVTDIDISRVEKWKSDLLAFVNDLMKSIPYKEPPQKRNVQMGGWYELSKSSDGQFFFVLKAGNGEVILTSEMYHAKSAAENGVTSVQANCSMDERYERKIAVNGKAFFNLKAANHQVIGTSQMYSSEASREAGIASVKLNGLYKTIKDNV